MRTLASLRINDTIEDILITLTKQYHLIRLLKSPDSEQGLFLCLALDRSKSNLALAPAQSQADRGRTHRLRPDAPFFSGWKENRSACLFTGGVTLWQALRFLTP